jgi:hypothetical protein
MLQLTIVAIFAGIIACLGALLVVGLFGANRISFPRHRPGFASFLLRNPRQNNIPTALDHPIRGSNQWHREKKDLPQVRRRHRKVPANNHRA